MGFSYNSLAHIGTLACSGLVLIRHSTYSRLYQLTTTKITRFINRCLNLSPYNMLTSLTTTLNGPVTELFLNILTFPSPEVLRRIYGTDPPFNINLPASPALYWPRLIKRSNSK